MYTRPEYVDCISDAQAQVLIPDGRVTEDGLRNLIEATECICWISPEDDPSESLVENIPDLASHALPSLDWILQDDPDQDPYPYEKTFEEGARDIVAIIHTSGTTGTPKPIYHTNGLWTSMAGSAFLSKRHWPRGIAHESWIGRNGLNCCAPQWLAGIAFMIQLPAFGNSPCIMLPPDAVGLSPQLFKEILQFNKIDGLKCPPHTVVTLYEDPESRELMKSLEYILFLGAPLDRAIGDDLARHIRLTPLIGSTETGDQMSFRPANRDLWYTHDFVPEIGSKMVPVDVGTGEHSNIYEKVIEFDPSSKTAWFQPAFWNPAHKNMTRIETNEIYTPITDSDGRMRWIFTSRKDDLTKLNWLAKFHAQDMEKQIQSHPEVKSVLVGGEGRPTPYVIVELRKAMSSSEEEKALLDDIYTSAVTSTNKADVDEIRIPRQTLIAASSNKPFKRNVKLVVLRKDVEQDYLQEIEAAYKQLKL